MNDLALHAFLKKKKKPMLNFSAVDGRINTHHYIHCTICHVCLTLFGKRRVVDGRQQREGGAPANE